MKILAIESSATVASVALLSEEELLAEYTMNHKKTHSQTLLPMLDEIVKMSEMEMKEIDAVAVSAGPGSFTGLRIGSATAKGIAQAEGAPIISVPTLEGMAYNLYGSEELICPVMDARREHLYTGIYTFEHGNEFKICMEQDVLSVEELCEKLNQYKMPVVFLGDGIELVKKYQGNLKVSFSFAPPHLSGVKASSIGVRAICLMREGKAESAKEHTPVYLRMSQAEREREEKSKVKKAEQGSVAPEAVRYRTMELGDLEQIMEMETAYFSEPWTCEDFRKAMQSEDNLYTVAEYEGEILGYCGIWGVSGEGQIDNVAVKEDWRNKKIGYELLKRSIAEAEKMGNEAFTLEVRKSNLPAIALYKNLGFAEEGIRKDFYKKPAEDAVIMWKRK